MSSLLKSCLGFSIALAFACGCDRSGVLDMNGSAAGSPSPTDDAGFTTGAAGSSTAGSAGYTTTGSAGSATNDDAGAVPGPDGGAGSIGAGNDAGDASGVGIFATVNGEQQTFTTELLIPFNPVALGAVNLVRKETLIIIVTGGEIPHGTYACGGGSVRFEYWPPNVESPSAPYLADSEHGACTITYDWTGEFYEGFFMGTLSPAAGGPAAFNMSGTFRLHN